MTEKSDWQENYDASLEVERQKPGGFNFPSLRELLLDASLTLALCAMAVAAKTAFNFSLVWAAATVALVGAAGLFATRNAKDGVLYRTAALATSGGASLALTLWATCGC